MLFLSAIGDGESYLMMAQGMTIMQMPFTPTEANPGKPVLTIPGQWLLVFRMRNVDTLRL